MERATCHPAVPRVIFHSIGKEWVHTHTLDFIWNLFGMGVVVAEPKINGQAWNNGHLKTVERKSAGALQPG
jgi:hypothetical protein